MANAPTVTVPGLLSNPNAPHISSIAAFDTYVIQLQNSGRPEDQATASALQQISNALNLITSALIQSQSFTFNVPVAYHAVATNNTTLTTTSQAIPGCAITLPTTGQYLILGHVNVTCSDATPGLILMDLWINGAQYTNSLDECSQASNAVGGLSMSRPFVYNGNAGDQVTLQAEKQNNAGTAIVLGGPTAPDSSLTAIWLHGGLSQLPSVSAT